MVVTPRYFFIVHNTNTHTYMQKNNNNKKTQNKIAHHHHQLKIVSFSLVLIAITTSIWLSSFYQDN